MVRGMFIAIALAALAAFPLRAADAREERPPLVEDRLALRTLFDRAPGVITDDGNGITVQGLAPEVVLARVGPDGKLVTVCVDNEKAARRFFEEPVDQTGKGAREK